MMAALNCIIHVLDVTFYNNFCCHPICHQKILVTLYLFHMTLMNWSVFNKPKAKATLWWYCCHLFDASLYCHPVCSQVWVTLYNVTTCSRLESLGSTALRPPRCRELRRAGPRLQQCRPHTSENMRVAAAASWGSVVLPTPHLISQLFD